MRLRGQQQSWHAWGEQDPLWAILTTPQGPGGSWELEEFLATGRAEIEGVLGRVAALGGVGRRRALDFGCGVGRCSLALADHFDEVVGIDIAPSMIARAKELASGRPEISFSVNARRDLRGLPSQSFDFVYCNIVLQHMEVRFGFRYLEEFLRVLAPRGMAVFQLPTAHPPGPPGGLGRVKHRLRTTLPEQAVALYDAVNRRLRPTGRPAMEMHVYPLGKVVAFLSAHRGELRALDHDGSTAPEWSSRRFFVARL